MLTILPSTVYTRLLPLFTLVTFLSLPSPQAATYYVSPDGNDTSNGSSTTPWLTIQKGAATVLPGDTVRVLSGTYDELVKTVRSGTADSPIIFEGVEYPISGGFDVAHSHIVIKGFSVRGNKSVSGAAILLRLTAANCVIENNKLEATPEKVMQISMMHGDWGRRPSSITIRNNRFTDARYHALTLQGQGHQVASNFFTSPFGWDAVRVAACNTVIDANTFTNWSNIFTNSNHPDLIQAFANNGEVATNVVISRNFSINCKGTQIGNISDMGEQRRVAHWYWHNNIWIDVEGAMSIYAENFHFHNNLFLRSGRNTGGPLLFRSAADLIGEGHNGSVINNLFVECGSRPESPSIGWYFTDAGVTNFTADYNLVVGPSSHPIKTGFITATRELHGLNGKHPAFIDAAQLDFRLSSESPCIGKALPLSDAFRGDFGGRIRTEMWDVGPWAYSFYLPSSRPSQPIGVRVASGN